VSKITFTPVLSFCLLCLSGDSVLPSVGVLTNYTFCHMTRYSRTADQIFTQFEVTTNLYFLISDQCGRIILRNEVINLDPFQGTGGVIVIMASSLVLALSDIRQDRFTETLRRLKSKGGKNILHHTITCDPWKQLITSSPVLPSASHHTIYSCWLHYTA
jgi:hypothetical protein